MHRPSQDVKKGSEQGYEKGSKESEVQLKRVLLQDSDYIRSNAKEAEEGATRQPAKPRIKGGDPMTGSGEPRAEGDKPRTKGGEPRIEGSAPRAEGGEPKNKTTDPRAEDNEN